MIHRFLTLQGVPELRAESASTESDVVPEVEVLLPVETFWEVQNLIHEFRYMRHTGLNTNRLNQRLQRLVLPFVLGERERLMLITYKG